MMGVGKSCLGAGPRQGAAVDNKRPLPPIVRESFVMPSRWPAVVREARAGMLCHAGGPAGRIRRQLSAHFSWEP